METTGRRRETEALEEGSAENVVEEEEREMLSDPEREGEDLPVDWKRVGRREPAGGRDAAGMYWRMTWKRRTSAMAEGESEGGSEAERLGLGTARTVTELSAARSAEREEERRSANEENSG